MTSMHPSTIWLYLARFFPRDVLLGLMAADCTARALLEQRVASSLKELHREIDFRFLHLMDGTAGRLWNRAVADHLRVLRIGPYFVCDALDHSKNVPFRHTVRPVRSLLARFRNLEEYHILWHERPTSTLRRIRPIYDHLSNTLCLASSFLTVPFSSAPNLRSLTVEISLDKAEHVFLPSFELPSLRDFSLCIRDDHADDLDAAGYVMGHHLARFLNNAHRTLRSFSFETSLNTDFSPFFSALGFFPCLSKLALSIPTADPHLGDPSTLNVFLRLHRDTLEHFALRGFSTNKSRTDSSCWLSQCLSEIRFSSLRTLNIGTSFISLDVVILCIEQWADTLTELDITGEYMSYEAVEDILDAFVDRPLTSLNMSVTTLCPELVDMLAAYLPHLIKLHLRIRTLSPHRCEPPTSLGSVRKQKVLEVERFCAEMNRRTYNGWELEDIGIWRFASKLQYQARCVNALRDSLRQI
ncbi:hypothetical protein DFH07DRAFT_832469 [Mycena maculata]|uniref:Uncharacterized protein n=1 Tax=Mycena maculata TaxID=230809 RepID=A0AAD7IQN3_9AGAR|nr:hypothetical protein DFH07DRAFT_832469 [Mycena maculata]